MSKSKIFQISNDPIGLAWFHGYIKSLFLEMSIRLLIYYIGHFVKSFADGSKHYFLAEVFVS